jgi:undecaprenyl-diphosphatase
MDLYPDWNYPLFTLINRDWAHEVLDMVLPLTRNKLTWVPVYMALAAYFVAKHRKEWWRPVLIVVMAFMAANTVAAEVLKPLFGVLRPCNDPTVVAEVVLRVDCGPGKSFPSAHAANHFAISICLLFVLTKRSAIWPALPLLLWAALVAYAQVYVGVHYPYDVLAGAALGSLVGAGVGFLGRRYLMP